MDRDRDMNRGTYNNKDTLKGTQARTEANRPRNNDLHVYSHLNTDETQRGK